MWFAPVVVSLVTQVVQSPSHAPWGLLNIIKHRLLAHASLDGYLSIYILDKKGGQQSLADHTATSALLKEATLHEAMHEEARQIKKQS